MKRTLSLRRESLAALTPDDLATFGGAARAQTLDAEACVVIRTDETLLICLSVNCETWDSYCSCRV